MNVDDAFRKLMGAEPPEEGPEPGSGSSQGTPLPEVSAAGRQAEAAAASSVATLEPPMAPEAPVLPPEPEVEPFDLSRVMTVQRYAHHPIDSRSQIAEEYRILRTRLLAMELEKPSILLTSCHHNEGKTRTALHLALSLARRASRKILLVDFDLRRPRLHRLLGLPKREHDIASALRGRCAPEDAMIYSEEDNLYVMAAKREYSNGTEYLETRMARELIDRMHASFDLVVMDICPSLSTCDPAIVGPHVGGAFMVVRCLQTQRESVNHAINSLREVGVPIVGVVLTFMKYFIPRYLYRYQYYHGQYYATSYGYGGKAYGQSGQEPPPADDDLPGATMGTALDEDFASDES